MLTLTWIFSCVKPRTHRSWTLGSPGPWNSYIKGITQERFRTGLSQRCHFGMWTNWRQPRHCRLLRTFDLSLEAFKLEALPMKTVLIRNNFFWPIYMSEKTTNYWTSLLIVLQWPSPPLKPQDTSLHPWLRMSQTISFSPYRWTSHESGDSDSLMYVGFPYICMQLNLVISSCSSVLYKFDYYLDGKISSFSTTHWRTRKTVGSQSCLWF